MRVSNVAEMREMDRRAIEDLGIPEMILMENAAMAVVRVLRDSVSVALNRVLLFCGAGNNGGDGMAVARLLASYGANVQVALAGHEDRLVGATRQNYLLLQSLGINMLPIEEGSGLLSSLCAEDIVIDALLGTGISRDVTGPYAEAIERINASPARVLSVDIPSGINGNSGQVMGIAVQADWTVTFGAPKLGNLLYPGYAHGGELVTCPISFPQSLYQSRELRAQINSPIVMAPRSDEGHKGTFGDALFVAGAGSYYGAPFLSATAMLKAGGGYSRLATPRSLAPYVATLAPELVLVPQSESESGAIALSNLESLLSLASEVDFVVAGPGLSLDNETQELVRCLLAKIERPLLIDGDGITAVHQHLDIIRDRTHATVLTPHMGEMARIVGKSIAEIEEDKIAMLRQTTTNLGAIIVLKGAHSLIGLPTGEIYINLSGNSGMATAGTGDVLTGTIAAMVGLGLETDEAVRQGVFVHGVAGDLAAAQQGPDGITARDVLFHLPEAMAMLRNGRFAGKNTQYKIATV